MIERLVLFGATGDLAGRYLLPALAALHAAGRLPDGFTVVGAAREKLDDEAFRRSARERLEEHAADVPATAREAFVRSLRYRPVDVADAESVASLVDAGGGPVAAYLALPPGALPGGGDGACGAPGCRRAAGSPSRSRSARTSTSAIALNRAARRDARRPASRRSSASTTSWAWRPCRTCSRCGSRTRSSRRSGTATTSSRSRSSGRRRSRWRAGPATTTAPARSRTCCRTTCSSSCR